MESQKVKIIAHRGASALVEYENTIEAFEKAVEIGADAIELDVRKTKDGQIIVVHDEIFIDKKISEWTYYSICLETTKAGYTMPLLEEVLMKFKARILIDIEIKEQGYTKEIIDIIKKHLTPEQFYIRSFHDDVLKEVKECDQKIKTVLLLGLENPKHVVWQRLSELFPNARIRKAKCDFVSPHYQLVILGFVWRMHLIKKPVLVWTVDDEDLMMRLIKKNVDGIITNYPNIGIKVRNEYLNK